FGAMRVGAGRAFMADDRLGGIPVAKEWATLEGRKFLVEQVPAAAIAGYVRQLPAPRQANLRPVAGSVVHVVSKKRLLPEPKLAGTEKGPMKVASLSAPAK